ncbi:MAG: DUF3450 domain-containing protein [Gammaproteobacteria bacterium]
METLNFIKRTRQLCLVFAITGLALPVVAQEEEQIDEIVETGVERTEDAAASQARIDQTMSETDRVVSEYKRQLKVIDGLKVYNALLQRQLDDQQSDMEKLRRSIDEVAVIERQITPTMLRMLEGLDAFIQRDIPFLIDERNDRVERLRAAVERSDVTTAEKFRTILEAFNIEGNYGRTIESYSGTLELGGARREVDFLKIGRIALMYQTADRETNGVWDQTNRTWIELDEGEYRNYLAKGMQIARSQIAPDILMVPIVASEIE